ncbi:hypothetical protein E0401_11145 [Escherichia coli]|nr:hypothetical protein [Escherichia coli]EFA4943350.1 hypothetical protein [Escherichia coli]EFA5471439.1 hypothetical protein [Escherichia coli]EFA5495712.1 hypothetical protein [Escherichia coli]EFA5504656.1 hypothetical protein [Escherichia coli]
MLLVNAPCLHYFPDRATVCPGCGGAAESRRGEVTSILREAEQKTAIHTLNQSEPSSLIVGFVHIEQKWC